MIKNFEEIKKQLGELASVINSFKSEAVQLKIVELVFAVQEEKPEFIPQEGAAKRKMRKKKQAAGNDKDSKRKIKLAPGGGAVALLSKLYGGDFFKKPRTIGDLVKHAEVNYARKFKANEFSGRLARMVRDGQLKRTKNADDQYEYIKQ
jgi:hypothetical protein